MYMDTSNVHLPGGRLLIWTVILVIVSLVYRGTSQLTIAYKNIIATNCQLLIIPGDEK